MRRPPSPPESELGVADGRGHYKSLNSPQNIDLTARGWRSVSASKPPSFTLLIFMLLLRALYISALQPAVINIAQTISDSPTTE